MLGVPRKPPATEARREQAAMLVEPTAEFGFSGVRTSQTEDSAEAQTKDDVTHDRPTQNPCSCDEGRQCKCCKS